MLFYLSVLALGLLCLLLLLELRLQTKKLKHQKEQMLLERRLIENKVAQIVDIPEDQEANVTAWSGWRKFRVTRIVEENQTIKSFYLIPHDGKTLPEFLPGQHLTFRLKVPGKSKPVIRCYSLSDAVNENEYYRISVRRQAAPANSPGAPSGVSSSYFHDHVVAQDILDVRAPAGKFYLDLTEKTPVVLVAGGIGLTPSLAMLNSLYRQASVREVWLFYAVRNEFDLVMVDHLAKLSKVMKNFHSHFFFADIETVNVSKNRHSGYVTTDKMFHLMQNITQPQNADFYVCGPPPLMDSIVSGLRTSGIHEQRVHFESFGPASLTNRTEAKTANKKEGTVADIPVKFHLSTKSIDWNPSCGTLLEAAEAAGINMDSGCRAGSCGTCLTAILAGGVNYIEEPGIEIETGSCLPCIAIPNKDLELNA